MSGLKRTGLAKGLADSRQLTCNSKSCSAYVIAMNSLTKVTLISLKDGDVERINNST